MGIPHGFEVDIVEGKADIRLTGTDPKLNSLHGLIRSLLANYVIGVTKGWEKTVELIGVGYKAVGGGAEVILSVGFTHPVKITTPDKNTSFKITDNTKRDYFIYGILLIIIGIIISISISWFGSLISLIGVISITKFLLNKK